MHDLWRVYIIRCIMYDTYTCPVDVIYNVHCPVDNHSVWRYRTLCGAVGGMGLRQCDYKETG